MRTEREVNLAAAYDAADEGEGHELTFASLARAFTAVLSNRDEGSRLEPWSRQLGERSAGAAHQQLALALIQAIQP
jgi:hypothetical protein